MDNVDSMMQKLKLELYKLIEIHGLQDARTIEKSQELDKLVSEQQKTIFLTSRYNNSYIL